MICRASVTANVCFALSLLIGPATTRAAAAVVTCADAAAAAERQHGLPAGLLLAIGKVESGQLDPRTRTVEPWPWSIDVQGRDASFANKASAIAAVEALQAGGETSIDVGCFQINLHYHPDAFADLDAAFDPALNADAAARFLIQLHGQSGDWGQATGAYHSQTVSLAVPYRREVARAAGDGSAAPAGLPSALPAIDPTLALLRGAWRATLPGGNSATPVKTVAARATPPTPAMLLYMPFSASFGTASPTSLRDLIWRQH